MEPGDLVRINMPGAFEHNRRATVVSLGSVAVYDTNPVRISFANGTEFVELRCDWLKNHTLIVTQDQVKHEAHQTPQDQKRDQRPRL